MKAKTIYTCEKCGKEFVDDFDACLDHERKHVEPVIQAPKALFYEKEVMYPRVIQVEMSNGATVEYYNPTEIYGPETKAEDPLPQTEGLQEKEL